MSNSKCLQCGVPTVVIDVETIKGIEGLRAPAYCTPCGNVLATHADLHLFISELEVVFRRALRQVPPSAGALTSLREVVRRIAERSAAGEDERRLSESFASLPDDVFRLEAKCLAETLHPIRVEARRLFKIWKERVANLSEEAPLRRGITR